MTAKPKVFLCYATEWRPVAEHIFETLSEVGCDPWMDKKSLLPGDLWAQAIENAIRRSDIFVPCISRQFSGQRRYLQREIKIALDVLETVPSDQVFVIPIRLEPTCEVPAEFQGSQWDDYFVPGGSQRLIAAIAKHCKKTLLELPSFYTWPDQPVALAEFSTKLVAAVDEVASRVASAILNGARSPIKGHSALRRLLKERIASVKPPEGLDIEVTCLDENRIYVAHPWQGVIGRNLNKVWAWCQGHEFPEWLWAHMQELYSGRLAWIDIMASDPEFERAVRRGWDYQRRTIISFLRVPISPEVFWTVAIEGHEVIQIRRPRGLASREGRRI